MVAVALVPVLVLVLVACAGVARAHEYCLDGTFPTEPSSGSPFLNCSAYNEAGRRTCLDSDAFVAGALAATGLTPGSACADHMVALECVALDAWSGHLFNFEDTGTVSAVPTLCEDFALSLYAACAAEVMDLNPFLGAAGSLAGAFASDASFVAAFGASPDNLYCTSGAPYDPAPSEAYQGGDFVCAEKLLDLGFPDGVYITLAPVPGHPRVLAFASHNGAVELVRLGAPGQPLERLGSFLDLTGRVNTNENNLNDERGLLGLAFHKDFFANGRLFASYTGGSGAGETVVEEFSVADPSNATALAASLAPSRVVFTVSQPFANHNGGQLLFSPDAGEPHLFLMLGDGGSAGDPGNRAQDPQSFLGKVLRLDVDSAPTHGPGGAGYAVPADNPFVGEDAGEVLHEIWALGLRNPWRCSFDALKPSYLFCADVGQNAVEEVDLIAKGGNYGWKAFEGSSSFSGGTALFGGSKIDPVMQYTHAENDAAGKASVTGGYVVRCPEVPGLLGSYVFGDLYDRVFVAEESPPSSGQFAFQRVGVLCSNESPLECGNDHSNLFTFGEAAAPHFDLLFVSGAGVHRLVDESFCANATIAPSAAHAAQAPAIVLAVALAALLSPLL